MKKTFFFALVAICLSLAACQGNGNDPEKKNGIKIVVTNVTYTTADISILPHDTLAPYYCALTEKSEYEQLTDEELIEETIKTITTLIGYGPITGEIKHFSDYTSIGNQNGTIDKLDPGTKYVMWACYMDTIARQPTSSIYTTEFETIAFPE